MYAGSDEIWQYFQDFTQKYGLEKYCKFNHQVSRAAWNAKMGRWDVEVTNLAEGTTILDSCDILVNASGVLNSWRWPDIPGLKDFKGVLLHTARWDRSVDLSGRHVGVIGNGYGLPSIHHFRSISDNGKLALRRFNFSPRFGTWLAKSLPLFVLQPGFSLPSRPNSMCTPRKNATCLNLILAPI